jgi:hypothetical protein
MRYTNVQVSDEQLRCLRALVRTAAGALRGTGKARAAERATVRTLGARLKAAEADLFEPAIFCVLCKYERDEVDANGVCEYCDADDEGDEGDEGETDCAGCGADPGEATEYGCWPEHCVECCDCDEGDD